MTTVANVWGMRCPKCQSDEHLEIEVKVWTDLYPEGTDIPTQDHEWDFDSRCHCHKCDHMARVRAFNLPD